MDYFFQKIFQQFLKLLFECYIEIYNPPPRHIFNFTCLMFQPPNPSIHPPLAY